MTPLRVYDEPISNFPSALWLREVAREDFNDPVPMAVQPPRIFAPAQARHAAMVAIGPRSDAGREDASRSVMYDPLLFPRYSLDLKQELTPEGVLIRLTARQAD